MLPVVSPVSGVAECDPFHLLWQQWIGLFTLPPAALFLASLISMLK